MRDKPDETFAGKVRIRTILYRILCLALFFVGLWAVYHMLDLVVADDTASQTRVTFHDYYKEARIDRLFVGTSHSVRAIDAAALSDALDEEVFNLSSAGQDLRHAYYLVKEAVLKRGIGHIYLEVSSGVLNISQVNETSVYILSDYMRSQSVRAELLAAFFDSNQYVNACSRLRRNFDPHEYPDVKAMYELYRKKCGSAYREFAGNEIYHGKGQWNSGDSFGDETAAIYLSSASLDRYAAEDVWEEQFEYLQKTIDLCRENGTELTLYMLPFFEYYFMAFEAYDEIAARIYKTAEDNGVDIIDFNRVRDQYLALEISDFSDMDHINNAGAAKATAFLAEYLTNPRKDYFYETSAEKYPERSGVLWAGYDRWFMTEEDEFTNDRFVREPITGVRLEVEAVSYRTIPVDARIWLLEKDAETDVWTEVKEIPGERIDDCRVQFIVPYDRMQNRYRLMLLEPETNHVLYEVVTDFYMR